MYRWIALLLSLAALGCAGEGADAPSREPLDIREILATEDTAGFARAVEPRNFEFPVDHGPHPEFKTEWWYYTGNLFADDGRRFGFQFTIFRSALTPESPVGESGWRSSQLYMGHFAVSDVENERFFAFERFSRDANGLAGARAQPFAVWLEDWEVRGVGEGTPIEGATRLVAAEDGVRLELRLTPAKPHVLQGDEGLSQKGAFVGNASYYYALTRIEAIGQLELDGTEIAVRGNAWMDREWSTSALESGQEGWDWFALQFEDGSELMYYQMRCDDGSPDRTSGGSWIDAAGMKRGLAYGDVDLQVLDHWTSPSGARYPARWRLRVPSQELDLEIRPAFAAQELELSFRYWEGAVDLSGTRRDEDIRGLGYVELTGYAMIRRGLD